MITVHNIYDRLADILAQLEPENVLSLAAPPTLQNRFDSLIEKSKQEDISVQEKDELNHFIVLERLIRLAKIKADIKRQLK